MVCNIDKNENDPCKNAIYDRFFSREYSRVQMWIAGKSVSIFSFQNKILYLKKENNFGKMNESKK